LLAAQAAHNVGLDQVAKGNVHKALAHHKNPVQMCYAYTKLSELAVENGEKDEEAAAELAE
jgi:hypothetical protein